MASTLDTAWHPAPLGGGGNPYLAGVYEPVAMEGVDDELEVVGDRLRRPRGVYLRNGPNPQFAPEGRYHWFDGDGMVHAVRFADGRASLRQPLGAHQGFVSQVRARRDRVVGSHRVRTSGITHDHLRLKDSANTDLVFFRDQVLALWYLCGRPYGLNARTLDSPSVSRTSGATLPCPDAAHAKVDEQTNELLFFDYGPRPPYMRYGVVGRRAP